MNTRKFTTLNLVTVAAVLLASATMLAPVGAADIGVTGFQTPPMSDFVPLLSLSGSAVGSQKSIPAPLSEIFALFPPPVKVIGQPSVHAPLSEIFALFPPPVKAIGKPSVHAPLSEIFALFPAPVKVPAMGIARQYQYGPAILATGFASPVHAVISGVYPNVPWQH